MALAAGTRLGPYEILAPLGAGGMGEVYRARDTRLGRDVAVKVLSALLADDPEALARFEREAKAVAALSHPAILALHDVGRTDASVYAVMELLEGETLRARLAAGPLPVRKAVEYAAQIAHGLAAAHERGIVHRDLKPDNLFLTRDGRVKILDFGLARQFRLPEGDDASPTQPRHTQPGIVMGTIGYMSPEQVRGQVLDHRSDLFAVGVLLHEMLTGRRPFQRDTSADTMSAILTADPPEPSSANPAVPPALDRIVRHCIEKSPSERFQSARDLAFDLENVSSASPSTGVTAARAAGKRRRVGRAALGLVALAVMAGAGVWTGRSLTTPPSRPTFKRLTFARGSVGAARFVPGSRSIVYGARWQGQPPAVFSAHPDSPESRALGHSSAILLAVSAAEELALGTRARLWSWLYHGTLARAGPGGQALREVAEDVVAADFVPGRDELAFVRREGGLHRVELQSKGALHSTQGQIESLRVAPSGDRVAWCESLHSGSGAEVAVAGVSRGKTVLARLRQGGDVAWSPDGSEVWFCEPSPAGHSTLEAVSLHGNRRVLLELPGLMQLKDVAADGRVLVVIAHAQQGIVARAPGAARETDLSWLDASVPGDLSADGRTLLFAETGAGGGPEGAFYSRGTDGAAAVRLGSGVGLCFSPDGRFVLSTASQRDRFALVPVGAGEARTIPLTGIQGIYSASFFDDSRQILFTGRGASGDRIFVVGTEGGQPRPVAPAGVDTFAFEQPLSPDGTRFVGARFTATGIEAAVYPVAGGAPAVIAGLGGDEVVMRWTADGRGLYVFNREGLPARIDRLDLATGRRRRVHELMPAVPAGIAGIRGVLMTADASAYAYTFVRALSDLYLVEGLR